MYVDAASDDKEDGEEENEHEEIRLNESLEESKGTNSRRRPGPNRKNGSGTEQPSA